MLMARAGVDRCSTELHGGHRDGSEIDAVHEHLEIVVVAPDAGDVQQRQVVIRRRHREAAVGMPIVPNERVIEPLPR